MLSYCWNFSKNTEGKNLKDLRTKNGRISKCVLSKCAVCNSKKSEFIKDQEASGLFRSLGIKRHLSKITLLEFVLKFLF